MQKVWHDQQHERFRQYCSCERQLQLVTIVSENTKLSMNDLSLHTLVRLIVGNLTNAVQTVQNLFDGATPSMSSLY